MTDLIDRGVSPPATKSTVLSASSVPQKRMSDFALSGGLSTTHDPFAPPIPELVIATKDLPEGVQHGKGVAARGT